MHIKQVIIRGFKTYKDQVNLAEDFHSGVNVVVGFNGSGKSNFFNAILFVISDNFGSLRAETRKSLLHEGAGSAVLTAFVEIVFDNADRRMPIDRDEVRVRRTIGVKKDDYSLDGKNATKNEIFALLESCGFTKSNPYYIVQQGKISELTLMNEFRRLHLIKEISGASVYDERRAESQRILAEMRERHNKTSEVVDVIAQRIRNLEVEQRELMEYQKLEKTRRCFEFELTDRDFRTAQDRIDALEVEKRDAGAHLNEAQREVSELHTQLNNVETAVQTLSSSRQRLFAEREELERARIASLEELTRAQLELSDERKRASEGTKSRTERQAEVKRLKTEVAGVTSELQTLKEQFDSESGARQKLFQQKQVCEAQRDQLIAKQSRKSQHSSIQERNKALHEEVERLREKIRKSAKMVQECDAEISRATDGAKEANQRMESRRVEVTKLEQKLCNQVAPDLSRINEQLEEVAEQRRLLLQDRERLGRERVDAERELTQCQNRIEETMPRAQRTALAEIKRMVAKRGLEDKVHGILLDNISVLQPYHIAVESTAGNSLFNLLVQDDDVAGQIVSFVSKGNFGAVVCTPLNQIQSRPRQYPSLPGVKPLVQVVTCSDVALSAVQQVFGKTLVCTTEEQCDEVSRKHSLDTITLDGDKVSSRGTLTGGYQDPSRFSRLILAERKRLAEACVQCLAPRLAEADAQAGTAASRLEQLQSQRRNLQDGRGQYRTEMSRATEGAQEAEEQVLRHGEAFRRHNERKGELESYIAECKAAVEAMDAEMKTKTLGDLTDVEQNRLLRLTGELAEADARLTTVAGRCHEVERILKSCEQHLQAFLRKRLHELETELIRDAQAEHEENVKRRAAAVARLDRDHKGSGVGLAAVNGQLEALGTELESKKAEHERLRVHDQELQAGITQQKQPFG